MLLPGALSVLSAAALWAMSVAEPCADARVGTDAGYSGVSTAERVQKSVAAWQRLALCLRNRRGGVLPWLELSTCLTPHHAHGRH